MYRIGTGDCFVLSFKSARATKPSFKMMIDCGAKSGGHDDFKKHLDDLIPFVEGEIDVLVITHEHQDHVLGFQRCEDILKDANQIKFKEIWLAWSEKDCDSKVEEWKEEFGQKKLTLALANQRLIKAKTAEEGKVSMFEKIYKTGFGKQADFSLKKREEFIETLEEYTELNVNDGIFVNNDPNLGFNLDKKYKGGLAGMEVVKKLNDKEQYRYLKPGMILEELDGLENIRIYILGPPLSWLDVKTEHGKDGETYKHNKELELVRQFSSFNLYKDHADTLMDAPFTDTFNVDLPDTKKLVKSYKRAGQEWRRIDYDWLFSSGELSLRLTRGINNLSVVMAIEFIESGKVMLFPGDAEFGSWRTWHDIEWSKTGQDGVHLTEDLLNRTIFYKVAHHMSHNGTAKEKGLEMMTSDELVAMGTVDYDNIHKNWQNTMPNRGIVRDLLDKTKGKLIIMNTDRIFFDKHKTIPIEAEINRRLDQLSTQQKKAFENKLKVTDLFKEYTVDGS